LHRFHQYISGVESGKQVTGDFIKLAVKRHLSDIEKSKTDWPFYFDEDAAQMFISFVGLCRHWKNSKFAGNHIELEPHQCFYFGSLFGWKRKDNGLRRFRRSYKQVARKNGKTTELAVISIYHLLADNEKGAQVYCAATKDEQARILVNDAGQIILATPDLRSKFKTFSHTDMVRRVVFPKGKSFIASLGRDSKTQDGFDPSMGNVDEFHEHKTTELLNVIVSGMGARAQPMLNIITTAGFDKSFPCYEVTRRTGIEILKGIKTDDEQFIVIYEPDEDDNWLDESTWIKSNPNLGVSVELNFLRSECKTAVNESGRTEVNFKTKHLNIWTDAADVWISDEKWLLNTHKLTHKDLLKQICYGGLDLAKGTDINSFTLFFPNIKGYHAIKVLMWIPEERAKIVKNELDYIALSKLGYIKLIVGNIIDIDVIVNDILKEVANYNFKSFAFDRYIAYHGIIQSLVGQHGLKGSELGQGFISLSAPTKQFETGAMDEKYEHFNNPILRWMLGNVEIEYDAAGNMKPSKGRSKNKIDGIASTINAIAEWMSGRAIKKESIYNSKNLKTG
jgi:phage terminase large subunit-like protein